MNILIAEDDTVSRRLLRHIVESQPGCKVIEVSHGTAAWNLLQQGLQPDLCLLDIQIPGMDGLELLRRIRGDERLKDMKVIFCTNVNDRATIAQAAALSVNYYFLKPYVKAIILEQIRKMARQLESHERPETPVEACERLGINIGTYSTMLKMLADETVKAAQVMRTSLKVGDHKTIASMLHRLKGASLNLGVTDVFSLICEVETALEAADSVAPGQSAVAKQSSQKTQAPSVHSQLAIKRLADLEAEAQRLLDEA